MSDFQTSLRSGSACPNLTQVPPELLSGALSILGLRPNRSADFISWTITFKLPVLSNSEEDLEPRAFTKGAVAARAYGDSGLRLPAGDTTTAVTPMPCWVGPGPPVSATSCRQLSANVGAGTAGTVPHNQHAPVIPNRHWLQHTQPRKKTHTHVSVAVLFSAQRNSISRMKCKGAGLLTFN